MRTLLTVLALVITIACASAFGTRTAQGQVHEEQVRIPVDSGITLAGTLVLPPGDGPFPAVVLLSTSLAEDRDATTGGFRPLRVLADSLAASGIASIRWDDRGIGQSTGEHVYQYTTEDLVSDALKAIELLKGRDEIDREGIGVSGISHGGILSSFVAARSADVRFIVPLSGVVSDPFQTNMEFRRRVLERRGLPAGEMEALMELDRRALEVSLTGAGKEELTADMRTVVRREWEHLPSEERDAFQDFDDYFQQSWYGLYLPFIGTPFYRSFLELDMRSALEGVSCAAYFVFGGEDEQIVAADAAPVIAESMAMAGNDDWAIRVFPGANHYLTRPWGIFAPGLLNSVTTWIRDHTRG